MGDAVVGGVVMAAGPQEAKTSASTIKQLTASNKILFRILTSPLFVMFKSFHRTMQSLSDKTMVLQ